MMSDVFGVLATHTERSLELNRQIGFAKGQIEEALAHLDGQNYWAEKALRRVLDEFGGKTYAGEARL